jgi:hypothetical protein
MDRLKGRLAALDIMTAVLITASEPSTAGVTEASSHTSA